MIWLLRATYCKYFFYSIPHSPFINIPFNLLTTDWLKQAVNEDEKKWVEWAILTLKGWPHHFRIPAFCFPRWYVISSRTMLISSLTPALVCVTGYKLLVYMYDKLSNNVHTTNYPLAWRFCRRFILWICDFLCHSRTNFFHVTRKYLLALLCSCSSTLAHS